MPKRLTVNPEVEADAKGWVRSLIRSEMARQNLTYRELAERLASAGMEENERNIANKVARGELSAVTFLLCLKVMGCETLSLDDRSFASAMKAIDDHITIDQALAVDLVKVIERDDEAGVYRIQIGMLSTPITILLSSLETRVRPTLSHWIIPPGKRSLGVNLPAVVRSPALALNRIIRTLIGAYEAGVRAGCTPDDSWLVPFNLLRGSTILQAKRSAGTTSTKE